MQNFRSDTQVERSAPYIIRALCPAGYSNFFTISFSRNPKCFTGTKTFVSSIYYLNVYTWCSAVTSDLRIQLQATKQQQTDVSKKCSRQCPQCTENVKPLRQL